LKPITIFGSFFHFNSSYFLLDGVNRFSHLLEINDDTLLNLEFFEFLLFWFLMHPFVQIDQNIDLIWIIGPFILLSIFEVLPRST
jgi:hypothetical protein